MRRGLLATLFAGALLPSLAAADAPAPDPASTPAPAPPGGFPEARPPAERRIPSWRFVMNNLFIFRYNPLGLEDQLRAGFQRRLVESYDVLFRDTFFFFGAY